MARSKETSQPEVLVLSPTGIPSGMPLKVQGRDGKIPTSLMGLKIPYRDQVNWIDDATVQLPGEKQPHFQRGSMSFVNNLGFDCLEVNSLVSILFEQCPA